MKHVGGLMRIVGTVVVGLVLLAAPAQAAEAPAAPVAVTATAADMDSPSKRFEQRYAEREQKNEALQSFEGGQSGGAGIYIGGTTVVLVLLVVLLLVLL